MNMLTSTRPFQRTSRCHALAAPAAALNPGLSRGMPPCSMKTLWQLSRTPFPPAGETRLKSGAEGVDSNRRSGFEGSSATRARILHEKPRPHHERRHQPRCREEATYQQSYQVPGTWYWYRISHSSED